MAGDNGNFNHFCGWSKWAVGWIVEDEDNANLNRVVQVPMPAPVPAMFPQRGWIGVRGAGVSTEGG